MAGQRRGGGAGLIGSGVSELREALSQLVDPRGVVMLTRERIDDALQDAVSRGRVTADDAQELVASLVERGRRQTQEVLGELERVLAAKTGHARRATSAGSAAGRAAPTRSRTTAGRLPIAGYDDLNATEVRKRLAGLSAAQLHAVRDHERANAKRKTVLEAIGRKLKSS